MKLPIYQVDAFAAGVFSGNPAAVVPLEEWLANDTMQAIAMENNVAETAFFVAEGDGSEAEVAALSPVAAELLASSPHAVIATAVGNDYDFVSRFFGPHVGIDEDPVTGSAHCSLVPYWAAKLDKTQLRARQISPRGGDLACELRSGRVFMTGAAVTFLEGVIHI
ncbi:UNVERIFIED_CONTAM: hypothetical protein GTU68_034839 [Idotea baltica]|nr:hypothetical protein [Idotea baltica]